MIKQMRLHAPAAANQPLDLTDLSETATIQPQDLAHTLWVLSTPSPPSKIVLPASLIVRRRLARAGLVFAADRRDIALELENRAVRVSEAVGIDGTEQLFALEHYDKASDRIRVISKLESNNRRPPSPDPYGRRYYWIDGLGVARGHRARDFFDHHADQCLFELVDNVHRWAKSERAMGIVSATDGGGGHSHNRLHVVVVDIGMGILASARAKAAEMAARGKQVQCLSGENEPAAETALAVMTNLVEAVYSKREVWGARGGHGLNTITGYVSRWNGTIDLISSFEPGRAMHIGRRGQSGDWNSAEFAAGGLGGTIAHLTLNATRIEAPRRTETRCGALAVA